MSLKRVGRLCDARCAGQKGGTSPGLRAALQKGWDVSVMRDGRLKRVGRRADEQKGWDVSRRPKGWDVELVAQKGGTSLGSHLTSHPSVFHPSDVPPFRSVLWKM